MAHLFDVAYFSYQDEMDMLRRMQEEVLKTVIRYAPIAIEKPDDYEARANLMWASSWALNGFLYSGIRQATVCHMMEHELSAYYDITHGHGIAILILRWLRYVLDEKTAPDIYRFGINCFGIDSTLTEKEGAAKSIEALEHFYFDTLGLQSHLSDLGIGEENFDKMAKAACRGGILKSFTSIG